MSTSKKKLGPKAYKKISERQKRFAEEFVICGIQEEALRRSGYRPQANQRLRDNPLVQAYIEQLRKERNMRCAITADRALEELARMAFVDTTDLFNDDWSIKRKSELSEDQRRAIVGVKRKSTTSTLSVKGGDEETSVVSDVELKTAKEGKLSEMLRHLGLLKEEFKITGTLTLADLVPKRKPRA